MRKRWKRGVQLAVICLGMLSSITAYAATGVNVAEHSESDVRNYLTAHGVSINGSVGYQEDPVTTSPYSAGSLSDSTLNSALATLNAVRYIAGLNANVTLDSTYNAQAQAGTLVMAVNDDLDHYPPQPGDMDDTLYQLGYTGTSHSNIGSGHASLNSAIIAGWMSDSDKNNIDVLGHRRWILNPAMGKTGFGFTGKYSAMISMDDSATGSAQSGVVWPAQEMPLEYFKNTDAWSYIPGSSLTASAVSVTLERTNDENKQTWNFSSSSADGYFNVSNIEGGYIGQPGSCVIFRPSDLSITAGDSYHVTIKNSGSVIADYNVHFFSTNPVTSFSLPNNDQRRRCSDIGDEYQLWINNQVPSDTTSEYVWESSDESVATVKYRYDFTTKYALVQIVGVGDATITAKAVNGGATATAKLKVYAHSPATTKEPVPAGCTTSGLTAERSCSICNQIIEEQEVIPALGHAYGEAVWNWAEDFSRAELTFTCSHDTSHVIETEGEITSQIEGTSKTYTAAAEYAGQKYTDTKTEHIHVYDAGVVTTEATCEEQGVMTFTCVDGDQTYDEPIAPKGHTEVVDAAVEATCTDNGLTEGSHCSVCNKVLTAQEEVPAKGHTEVIDEAVEATCTEKGLTEGKHCTVCNEVLTAQEEVPAKGHTEVVDAGVEATCTEKGLTDGKHCAVCSEVLTAQEEVPAKGHTEVKDAAVEATCTDKGLTEGSHCAMCNEVITAQKEVPAKGHTEVVDEAVEATCTENGLTEGSHCSVCNKVLTAQEEVPAKGHTEVKDAAVEATCTEPGLTEGKHCTVCNEVITAQEEVPAKGHTEVVDAAVEATCTEPGLTEGKHCAVCSEVITAQEEVPAKGHTEVKDAAVEATCTEAGLTEGSHCAMCNEVLTAQKEVPAKGHTEVVDEAVEATCTEKGLTEGSHCSVCGKVITEQEVIPAKGHTEVKDAAVEATCTESGLTEGTHCSVCSEVITAQEEVPAKGHTEVIDAAVEATCTEKGLTEGKHCAVCSEVITAQEEVPAKGHTEVVDAAVEATCTEKGLTEGKHCAVCNEVIAAQEEVPAKGHTETKDAAVEATCTETGLTEGSHCSVCSEVLTAQKEVPAKGHTEVVDEAVEATCTESGLTEGSHCSVCSEVITAQTKVPALGHAYGEPVIVEATCREDGEEKYTCSRCGNVRTERIAAAHSYDDGRVTREATCTEEGEKTFTCTVCGDSYVIAIPAVGHTPVKDPAVAPTYESEGKTEGSHCAVCNTVITAQQTIAKLHKAPENNADAEKNDPSADKEAASLAAVEKQVVTYPLDNDLPGSDFAILQAKAAKTSKNSIKLKWNRVNGAASYIVYGNRCGKNKKYQKIASVSGTNYTNKNLTKGVYYKYVVVAVNAGNKVIATSKTIHAATAGKKFGNAKAVKLNAKKKTLKRGKSFALKASAVSPANVKVKKHRAIAYESSNTNIAVVTPKGKISALNKGTCYVYAYAQNGVCAKIKITVK